MSAIGLWLRFLVFHMFERRATNPVYTARIQAILVTLLVLGVSHGIAGCASGKTETRATPAIAIGAHSGAANRSRQSSAALAASIGERQVGIPYLYGGADTKGFDCSGLVYYSYSHAGTQVARTTAGLWRTLQPVATDKLQAGDVLFFRIDGKMSHVGLYLGNGRFVHAPSTGRHVVVAGLDSDFYQRALIRGGRAE
jgi:cell wall-associated NlpC family hydrolase